MKPLVTGDVFITWLHRTELFKSKFKELNHIGALQCKAQDY